MTSQNSTVELLPILKEIQRNSKLQQQQINLQQQQIDLLIAVFENNQTGPVIQKKHTISDVAAEITGSAPQSGPVIQKKRTISDVAAEITGVKRPLSDVLDRGMNSQNSKVCTPAPPVERKTEHLDTMLEKASFLKLWDRISIKLHVDGGINNLKEKDKILEILTKASEKAKLLCAMNYDSLLSGGLTKIIKQGVKPDIDSLCYTVSNNPADANKNHVFYAHNIDMFTKTIEEFQAALVNPYAYYLNNPRKFLLSDSCFSDTSVRCKYRTRKQHLPFAICCMRKTGLLTFFVEEWAHEDRNFPNSSILKHYTTLDMAKFIKASDLESDEWKEIEKLLEVAASPTDMGIGSVSLFMHEHRGNVVCAKVIQSGDAVNPSLQLKIYRHASCKASQRHHVLLTFNDDGETYAARLGDETRVIDTILCNDNNFNALGQLNVCRSRK